MQEESAATEEALQKEIEGLEETIFTMEAEKVALQEELEEGKPDYLDLDKDGDKKEPMKKAAKDAKEAKK